MNRGEGEAKGTDIVLESETDVVLDAIALMLKTGKFDPSHLPEDPVTRQRLDELVADIGTIQNFVLCLCKGDLDPQLDVNGISAGCLKSLQSNLRHLTWQAQQIAQGDFSQRVDFLGDLSKAFNQMVLALDAGRKEMKERERELSDMNTRLTDEVSVRRQVEESLRESEEKYRSILKASPDDITMTDMDGVIYVVSPAALTVFGSTQEDELLGRSVVDFIIPEDRDRARANIGSMLRGVVSGFGEYRAERVDGSRFDIEVNGDLIRDAGGRPTGMVFIVRDITDRKRADQALRQANKKLNLLSSITRHDINNQLTVLQGYLEILEESGLDSSQDDIYRKIASAAQRISTMIQFTKEYEQIGVYAPVWQEIRALVETAAEEAPLGEVIVENDIPAGAAVFADPLIVKVCYNLMDNAVRYGGKITTIGFSVLEDDGKHVVVCEDDGNGISVNEKERIFERGYGMNTGLGLAISREILEITGITIHEVGEPGKGARFEITIPPGIYR
jgi:PAS domain S-box-containing protein